METVYAIKRGEGVYVDKGGRRTSSIPQMFFWNERESAEKWLSQNRDTMYVWKDRENRNEFEVVPVTVSFGAE